MTEAVTVGQHQGRRRRSTLTKDAAVVVYCVPGKKVLDDVPRSPADTDADVKITNPYTPDFEKAAELAQEQARGRPRSHHPPSRSRRVHA